MADERSAHNAAHPTGEAPPRPEIRLRTPGDVAALLPFVVGEELREALYVLWLGNDHRISRIGIAALAQNPDDIASRTAQIRRTLAAEQPATVFVIGYGPHEVVAPLMEPTVRVIAELGVTCRAMRIHDDCYHVFGAPPDDAGVPIDYASPVVAAAVFHGLAVTPGAAAYRATFEPSGVDRPVMQRVGDAAARWAADPAEEGVTKTRQLLDTALRVYGEGRRLDTVDAARLAALMTSIKNRDEAAESITTANARTHSALWSDLTRRSAVGTAACASLAGLAAWASGNYAVAEAAIERALIEDPGYRLAWLISAAVRERMPLPDWMVASDAADAPSTQTVAQDTAESAGSAEQQRTISPESA